MGLDAAIGMANGALANVSLGLSIISQNVANANTPQYALESATQSSLAAGSQDDGVASGLIVVATDPGLASQVASQTADASAWQTTSTALSNIQPVLGTVGSGNDLGSQLTAVQNAFSTLLADPSNATQQQDVVQTASTLAAGINTLAQSYGQAAQTAQDNLVSAVGQLNTALGKMGQLSGEIVSLQAQGQSTADLQNQRSQIENTISGLVDVHFVPQLNGDVVVLTANGTQLPTTGGTKLAISGATTSPSVSYKDGSLPGILLNNTDITPQLTGGSIGANITLRDQTMPAYQATLDEFSESLANRFAAQGLSLFTDSNGNIPQASGSTGQSGYVGFSNDIQVNPAVSANPALVRDGNLTITGSATGASAFTPNSTGLAGFSTLISRILTYSLGADVQDGVAQTPISTTGLGNDGTLSASFADQPTLGGYANALTAAQASDSANATSQASDANALQTSLQSKLTGAIGVNLDTELSNMVILQNAYEANAKVITTIEAMYTALQAMVTA